MSETSGIAQARASNQWMVNGDFGFDLEAGGQWQILEDTGIPPITKFFSVDLSHFIAMHAKKELTFFYCNIRDL